MVILAYDEWLRRPQYLSETLKIAGIQTFENTSVPESRFKSVRTDRSGTFEEFFGANYHRIVGEVGTEYEAFLASHGLSVDAHASWTISDEPNITSLA